VNTLETISIIGGGYVGLNNAVLFARKGFEVRIIDINPDVVRIINSGNIKCLHVLEEFIVKYWKFVKDSIEATTDYSVIQESKYVLIAVNTPLKVVGDQLIYLLKSRVPKYEECIDFNPLKSAVRRLPSMYSRVL